MDEDTGEVEREATSKDWAWERQLQAASLANEEELPEEAERGRPVRKEKNLVNRDKDLMFPTRHIAGQKDQN